MEGSRQKWPLICNVPYEPILDCFINKVEGIAIINTNPTVVGYTAMRAFLEQVGISLDAVQEQRFEALISESRSEPTQNFVPDFFSNTLSEMK